VADRRAGAPGERRHLGPLARVTCAIAVDDSKSERDSDEDDEALSEERSALRHRAGDMCVGGAVVGVGGQLGYGRLDSCPRLLRPGLHVQLSTLFGLISTSCAASQFHADVASRTALQFTSSTLSRCTGFGANIGDCTVTQTATNLPWIATGLTTSNVQIIGIVIDGRWELSPAACPAPVS
jgi:hypothetical protein